MRVDRVSESNMPGHTLIEPIFAKDTEGSRETALEVVSLGVFVFESRRARELNRFATGGLLVYTGLMRDFAVVDGCVVFGGRFCCVRGHICGLLQSSLDSRLFLAFI